MDGLRFTYPNSRLSQRLPIGTIPTIQNATGEEMRELWAQYYRPENVALIVVGDYDAEAVEAAITEQFGDWQAPPRAELPALGPIDPDYAGETAIYLDPALSESITISRHGAPLDEPDTAAKRREDVLRQIGYSIINRRMQRLSRVDDPPFRAAGLSTSDVFEEGRTTSLTINAAEGEWERGIAAAQEEYRRALEFGFSDAEVAEQVANFASNIESAASGAATRSNNSFVQEAISVLRNERVPTTPETSLERFRSFADEITPETVLAALQRELVPLDNPLIRFSGRAAPEGGADALRAAWNAGMLAEVAANDEAALAEFAYQDFGPAGTIVSDAVEPRLGIRTLTFANGLKLNLKRTDLQADRVNLAAEYRRRANARYDGRSACHCDDQFAGCRRFGSAHAR